MEKYMGKDGRILAIHLDETERDEFPEGQTKWISDNHESIQVAAFHYNKKKDFRTHRHILRPRLHNYSQECIIVFKGTLTAYLYDIDESFVAKFDINDNSLAIFYRGYHGFQVIKNGTRFIEVKNGPFDCTVTEDKVYLEQ